jgi:hypothetical protein
MIARSDIVPARQSLSLNPSVIAEDYTKNFHTFIIDFSKKYEILYARSLGKGILKTLSPAIEHNYKTKTKATKK